MSSKFLRDGENRFAYTSLTIQNLILVSIFCATSVGATKLSILLLYVRLFGLDDRKFKTHIYIGVFLSLTTAFGMTLVLVATCRPMSYLWNRYGSDEVQDGGYCSDTGNGLFAIGLVNLCLDFYLLSIPIPQILRLDMSGRKKLILCGLILFGLS